MDQYKLIAIIKNYPQVWDRNNEFFNKIEVKENTWKAIGNLMGCSGDACKNAFKGLREKYIREREKAAENQLNNRPWELLIHLQFLDPHIIERQKFSIHSNSSLDKPVTNSINSSINNMCTNATSNSFDKNLISLVRETEPLWNRNNNMYTMNRQVKNELWQNISKKLNENAHYCMLRWKALREKYIRQKNKFQIGEQKWELLEDLRFLDAVILYRRKTNEVEGNTSTYNNQLPSNFNSMFNNEQSSYCYSGSDDNSINDSSCDFIIKEEITEVPDSSLNKMNSTQSSIDSNSMGRTNNNDNCYQKADSSLGSANESSRKRTNSENSESCTQNKKYKNQDTEEKTPEKLFGDLVVLMLMKKPESERNLAMIEIMKILSK